MLFLNYFFLNKWRNFSLSIILNNLFTSRCTRFTRNKSNKTQHDKLSELSIVLIVSLFPFIEFLPKKRLVGSQNERKSFNVSFCSTNNRQYLNFKIFFFIWTDITMPLNRFLIFFCVYCLVHRKVTVPLHLHVFIIILVLDDRYTKTLSVTSLLYLC